MTTINSRSEMLSWQTGPCYLGTLLVAHTSAGVCAVLPGESRDELIAELARQYPNTALKHADDPGIPWFTAVMDYLEDSRRPLAAEIELRGTDFQCKVWRALQEIPSGSTASYAEIARRIGQPQASRAVAGACAANSLAVVVPCHRVLRSDGALSGYRWGIKRKQALLEREQRLSRPKESDADLP